MFTYASALSTNARNLVNQYQSAKWGIALTPPGTSGAGSTEALKAMASTARAGDTVDGYSVFTTRYLERLSQSADILLQASNNINLDFKGDTLNLSTANRSLTLTAGNQITTASAGTITTNGGNISLTGTTGGILFNNAFALNSGGGNINLNNAVTLDANLTTNSGSGTTTFSSTVNGAHGLTATAGTFSFASPLGGTTALGPVNLTSANALSLPTIFASSITASTASGNISGAGGLVTSGGNINLTAATDVDLTAMGIITNSGNATLSGRDVYVNTNIDTGVGDFTVNASRDFFLAKNDLTTGLVSYYKFDEGSGTTATDSAGSNNGTLTNGPSYSSSNPYGIAGNDSLNFDGASDYVSANALPPITGPFTLSTWIKRTSNAVYTRVGVIDVGSYSTNDGFGLWMGVNGDNVLTARINDNYGMLGTITPPLNTWANVAVVYNGTTVSTYLNGALQASTAFSNNPNPTSTTALGARADDLFNWGNSSNLDDTRIYNTALTGAQVSQLNAPQVSWNTGTTNITAANNISLDLKGDVITAAAGKNVMLSAGNSISAASAGSIATSQSAGANGNLTLTAGGTVDVSALTLNAGGDLSLTSPGAMTLGTAIAKTIFARTTGAAADLTIAASKVLTASGSGTPITLVAGRNFINNAGSGALSVSGGGSPRWLVYSSNPTSDTIGSLSNSFRRFSCTYGGACPTLGSGNGLLYSTTPLLTITPSTLAAIYGNAVNLVGYSYDALTSGQYLSVGDFAADTVTGSLTGSTTYSQGNNIGNYNINYSSGTLTSALGYGFTYANNATALNVGTRALSVAADAKNKTYGTVTDPALTYTLTNGSFYGSDGFTGALSRVAGETVVGGPYAILQNTLSAGSNYSISYTGANLNIAPATLTITGDAATRLQGQPNPLFTAQYSGFQYGDTSAVVSGLQLASIADGGSLAGEYAIVPSGAAAANYTFAYVDGVLTVTPFAATPNTVLRVSQNPINGLFSSGGFELSGGGAWGLASRVGADSGNTGNGEGGGLAGFGNVQTSNESYASASTSLDSDSTINLRTDGSTRNASTNASPFIRWLDSMRGLLTIDPALAKRINLSQTQMNEL